MVYDLLWQTRLTGNIITWVIFEILAIEVVRGIKMIHLLISRFRHIDKPRYTKWYNESNIGFTVYLQLAECKSSIRFHCTTSYLLSCMTKNVYFDSSPSATLLLICGNFVCIIDAYLHGC